MRMLEDWYGHAPSWQRRIFEVVTLVMCFLPSAYIFVGMGNQFLSEDTGMWFIPYILTCAGTAVTFWAFFKYVLKRW